MAANPYFHGDSANWWHGDEMFEGKSSSEVDVWYTWELGEPDPDGWTVGNWVEDMRRSEYLSDMSDEAVKELMRFIAKNRASPDLQHLVKYTRDYINATIEG